jgi:hypothetical protein
MRAKKRKKNFHFFVAFLQIAERVIPGENQKIITTPQRPQGLNQIIQLKIIQNR